MRILLLIAALSLASAGANATGYYPFGDIHWKPPVSAVGSLPTGSNVAGDTRVVLSPVSIYEWNGSAWVAVVPADAVSGPGSSTDNAIARWDGTTGLLLQNSSAIVSDAGLLSTPSLSVAGVSTLTGTTTAAAINASGTFNETQSSNATTFVVQRNTSTGASAKSVLSVENSIDGLILGMSSTGYSGAPLTNGSSGEVGFIYTNAAVPINIGVNRTNSITIGTSGNVGIGTASPETPLHVVNGVYNDAFSGIYPYFVGRGANGALGAPTQLLVDDPLASFGGYGYGLTGYSAHAVGAYHINAAGTFSDTSQPTYLSLWTTPSGSVSRAERLRVTQTGLVGIGTTDPSVYPDASTLLAVVSNTNNTNIAIASFGSSPSPVLRGFGAHGTVSVPTATQSGDQLLVVGGHGYGSTAFSAGSKARMVVEANQNWTDANQGARLTFATTPNNSSTSAEVMRINADGKVSIGGTADTYNLDVTGTANVSGASYVGGQFLVGTASSILTANEGLSNLYTQTAPTSSVANGLVSEMNLTGNTSQTNIARASNIQFVRTVTADPSDIVQLFGEDISMTIASSGGVAYSNGTSDGIAALRLSALTNTGSTPSVGYSGLFIATNSTPLSGRKQGIYIKAQTGGTNNARIADNVAYTGNYFINSSDTNPSVLSGTLTVPTVVAALTGNASTATTATNATNVGITDDTTTNATMYPTWVTTTTGNLPEKVSSTKLTFNPSTATLTTTTFSGALSGNSTTATTATNLSGGTVSGTTGAFSSTLSVTGTSQLTGNVGIGAASATTSQLQVTTPTSVTGTCTNSASGTTVTGTSTLFRTEFHTGDTITMNGETRTISGISTDTSLTTDAWTGANTGATATRAAVADFYAYPNGNIQAGGSRTSYVNGLSESNFIMAVANAPSTGATSTQNAIIQSVTYSGANASGASSFGLVKARGTEASPAVPSSGDGLGNVLWRGWKAANTLYTGASITGAATETWSSTAGGAKLTFNTTPNTTQSIAAALTLGQDQSATFGGGMIDSHLTTGTNADTVCLASDGTFLIQAAACTISKRALKENISSQSGASALHVIMALRPVDFSFRHIGPENADQNYYHRQAGFIAEDVAAIDPALAVYESDMKTPKSYRQESIISRLVGAIQQQQAGIEAMQSELKDLRGRVK